MKYIQYLSNELYSGLTLEKKFAGQMTYFHTDSQDIEPYQQELTNAGIDFSITGIISVRKFSIFDPSADMDFRIFVTDSSRPYLVTSVYQEWIRYYRDEPKPKYTIVYNQPGYLPESEPIDASNLQEMWSIVYDLEDMLSNDYDLDEYVECTYRSNPKSLTINGYWQAYYSNGYVIEVTKNY